ncbi:glycine/betaine ABC transporter permease [Microbacterium faecale]|uniref:Glycine/betaine ABC transporter permease n=1 Tax=Microbacterium faecale TaxID=1804630 RepID=A0A916YCG1_9MICO|nr:proline/glycine betaine ABC transporter permease [Microbacterium faecale]GGD40021.1 glycine/betaine ABC transporter permease [Microbacterium faecale]
MLENFRIPLGDWADLALDWFKDVFGWLLDIINVVTGFLVEGLAEALVATPTLVLIAVLALIGWIIRSWQLAVGTVVTMLLVVGMNQWENAMLTLALVLIATVIAIVIAVPLGILAARNDTFSAIVKPVLDFMQTMPAFVYLIPAVTFFSVGFVPGVFATILFSLPPGVRMTELGIRGVDSETVEAGQAFGAAPGQVLRGIQLPLATPTIMAGINQVIMLALSMAVVAGMAGANGLGKEVVAAISTLNIPLGVEAGLSVVVLAVFLDRVTAALGNPAEYRGSLLGTLSRRQTAVRDARADAEAAAAAAELSEAKGPRRAGF